MASRIIVPEKIYTLKFKESGQGTVTTKDLHKLNELLQQKCDASDIVLNTNALLGIRQMHALLVAYRSHPELFGRDSSEICLEQAQALMAAISDDDSMEIWRSAVKAAGAQLPTRTTTGDSSVSNWVYPQLPWVQGEDRDQDRGADNLTRLINRYDELLTNKHQDSRGPACSMLGMLKYAEIYDTLRSYLLKFITCPADITDLLDAYAIVLKWKDAYFTTRGPSEYLFYSSFIATAMLTRVLILYCAIVRNDQQKRIWRLLRQPEAAFDDYHTLEGHAMTWQELSDAVAASSFVKEKLYNTLITGLENHQADYILEAPVVGGICESILTAGTIFRAFGPVALPDDLYQVSDRARDCQSLDDKEFWKALEETLRNGLDLTVHP